MFDAISLVRYDLGMVLRCRRTSYRRIRHSKSVDWLSVRSVLGSIRACVSDEWICFSSVAYQSIIQQGFEFQTTVWANQQVRSRPSALLFHYPH